MYIHIYTTFFSIKGLNVCKIVFFARKGWKLRLTWVNCQDPRTTMMLTTQGIEFHLLCCFILCLSYYLWRSWTTAGCSCNKEYAMFCHHFYYQPERGESLLEEKLGSFSEPKFTQPESKVFTDFKSFLLDNAALKSPDRKKEKHLCWFSLFNTQEWKSVKSQSLDHHKNAVSLQMTRTQAARSFTQLTSTNPGSTFLPSFETPAVHKHEPAQSSCYLTHLSLCSMLYLLPRPVVYTFEKVPHFWSISA